MQVEDLEKEITDRPTAELLERLYAMKRELIVVRRMVWPMRELVMALQHDEADMLSDMVKTYLRDVYDHSVQIIEMLESYREMAASLNDLYMSAISNRMNEVMKVLTIMASFFIPVTFLAGVYGMNFEHIPELHWRWAYPTFWIACAGTIFGLAIFFYRKGWIGRK